MTISGGRRLLLAPAHRRAVWHGLIVAGLLFNATLVIFWLPNLFVWIDASAWRSLNVGDPYASARGAIDTVGAFIYPPPAVFLFAPLAWLPWAIFAPLFLGMNLAAVVVLAGRWAPAALVAFPPVLLELLNGNIHLLMAVAIWLGLTRLPIAWAFVLLTKVTPGIGVLWFAVRGEWRAFSHAVIATAALCVVTLAVVPELWSQWLALVTGAAPMGSLLPPLPIRLLLAAGLIVYAARTDRAWLVPVASLLAMPTVWLQSTALLLASFPLYWERARFARHSTSGVAPVASAKPPTPMTFVADSKGRA